MFCWRGPFSLGGLFLCVCFWWLFRFGFSFSVWLRYVGLVGDWVIYCL